MPRVSVWLVRTALLHLLLGVTMGAILLAGKSFHLPGWIWAMRPVHVEVLLFGFTIQLAFGVALWILPRTPETLPTRLPWVAGVLLNAGVLLGALVVAFRAGGMIPVGARILEAAALLALARSIWPRVRAFRG
jgi:hypothetical protein